MDKSLKIAMILTAVDKSMSSATATAAARVEKRLAKMSSYSKGLNNIGNKSLLAGGGVMGAITLAFNAAADMEKMNVALKTSFQGNTAAADAAFKTINKFAARTPYELGEVMTSFIKLKNMGLDPSEKALESYGNTASSMGKNLDQMIEAVADAATGEFERLKEFGIRASSQKDKVTFTFQGVKTTVGKNSKDIENYLIKLGNTKFAGGMEAQSKTASGQLSTLKDNVKLAAATAGKTLIPKFNQLVIAITPLIEKFTAFIDKHPKLISMAAKAGLGLLAFGGTAKLVSGGINGVSGVIKGYSKGMELFNKWNAKGAFGVSNLRYKLGYAKLAIQDGAKAVGTFANAGWDKLKAGFDIASKAVVGATKAFVRFGISLLTNPITWIILGIVALGVAVYMIIKHWNKITEFFARIWAAVKAIFTKAWEGLKALFFKYHPIGLVIKHWEKIKAFFSGLWDKVKGIFIAHVNWVMGLGSKFLEGGKNIVNSIWKGIKSMAHKPVEAIEGIVKKMRDFLPFSPAKTGPFKTLHKIRIVETIADSIQASPAVMAMKRVTGAIANYTPRVVGMSSISPVMSGSNFHITVNLKGSATQGDANMISDTLRKTILNVVKQEEGRKRRVTF